METIALLTLVAAGLCAARWMIASVLGWCLLRPSVDEALAVPESTVRLWRTLERVGELAEVDNLEDAAFLSRLRELKATGDVPAEPVLVELAVSIVDALTKSNIRLRDLLATAELQIEQQAADVKSHADAAATDSLTRLPNRGALDRALIRRVREAQLDRVAISFVLIDVDHFKQLNDTLGHQIGDIVLQKLARLLAASVRTGDFVGRYGGEEFAMVLGHVGVEQASKIVNQLLVQIDASRFRVGGQQLRFTASAGLASLKPGETIAELVGRADEALYAAKSGGRNVGFYHDGADCHRIAHPSGPTDIVESPAGHGDRTPRQTQMAAICHDLRSRAAELSRPEQATPSGDLAHV